MDSYLVVTAQKVTAQQEIFLRKMDPNILASIYKPEVFSNIVNFVFLFYFPKCEGGDYNFHANFIQPKKTEIEAPHMTFYMNIHIDWHNKKAEEVECKCGLSSRAKIFLINRKLALLHFLSFIML